MMTSVGFSVASFNSSEYCSTHSGQEMAVEQLVLVERSNALTRAGFTSGDLIRPTLNQTNSGGFGGAAFCKRVQGQTAQPSSF